MPASADQFTLAAANRPRVIRLEEEQEFPPSRVGAFQK